MEEKLIAVALFPVILILCSFVLPIGFTAFVCFCEKRLVWPYVPMDEAGGIVSADDAARGDDDPPPRRSAARELLKPTQYADDRMDAAYDRGFTEVATRRDGKGRIYRVRYDFWLSRDRYVLAMIGSGSMAAVPVKCTWLFTRLADGRCLVTLDHQNGCDHDLTGLALEHLAGGLKFDGLLSRHRKRMDAAAVDPVPFGPDPLADLLDWRAKKTDRLAELGHCRFLDADHTAWRFTATGAVRWAFKGHVRGFRRQFVPDKV